jgi:hypothetical protein
MLRRPLHHFDDSLACIQRFDDLVELRLDRAP